MAKKRYVGRYSKPPSTVPHSLVSSGLQSHVHHDAPQPRTVNDLLANLRLNAVAETQSGSAELSGDQPVQRPPRTALAGVTPSPTLPPELQSMIEPNTGPTSSFATPPTLNVAARNGAARAAIPYGNRRAPAGPAPPRSWLVPDPDEELFVLPKRESLAADATTSCLDMPGLALPAHQSLVAMALRAIVKDWEFWTQHPDFIAHLPGHHRSALSTYLSLSRRGGLGMADLEVLLLPPALGDANGQTMDEDPSALMQRAVAHNEGLTYLDLSGGLGETGHDPVRLKPLIKLLVIKPLKNAAVPESWDTPESFAMTPSNTIVPHLTHLSLALRPGQSIAQSEWQGLRLLAQHLPKLTHLSLAYWPAPSPTSFLAIPADRADRADRGAGRSLRAIVEPGPMLLGISKNLCGLTYLDLTGCVPWAGLLTAPGDSPLNWAADWTKITTIVMRRGELLEQVADEADKADNAATKRVARDIEEHVRRARAGQGRFITVETRAPAEFRNETNFDWGSERVFRYPSAALGNYTHVHTGP